MHRTTIPLESQVEKQLRRLAAQQRRSFKEVVNDLIKRGLKAYDTSKSTTQPLQWHTMDTNPHPDFDPSDRSTYGDLIAKKIL